MTAPTSGREEEHSGSSLARKVAVAVAGSTVTAAGVVMLVTPGPGIVAILGGFRILNSEFATPRKALDRLRNSRSRQPASSNVRTMPTDREEPLDPHHRSRRSG